MLAAIAPEQFPEYPPELVRYTVDEATRDAADVAAFLAGAGLAPRPGRLVGLPPDILLDLGAVVRLRRWEAVGISVHRDAGLPTAGTALIQVIQALSAAATDHTALATAGRLGRAVFGLTVTRFAWAGRTELGTDIVLDDGDDDAEVALHLKNGSLRGTTPHSPSGNARHPPRREWADFPE